MKRTLIIFGVVTLVIILFVVIGLALVRVQADIYNSYETELIERGTLTTVVEADGIVQSNQSALLFWKVSGEVDVVMVKTGDKVTEGDILATVKTESLPAYIVAAQAELISAERELDNLLNSDRQQAEALKAIDDAQKALEDSLRPEIAQAEALLELAQTQEALVLAEHNYKVVTAPTSQSIINAAYSNLLLAEDKIAKTEAAIVDAKNKDFRAVANSGVLEAEVLEDIRSDIREIQKQLEYILTQDRLAYQNSLETYNSLLLPPDPSDVALAESDLSIAKATLGEAQREWERVKDGFSTAEISVLEAELNDAIWEYERIKDGPHTDDIAALVAKITAAEAAIAQRNIIAPFSGTITQVHSKALDVINLGTLAFQLDDLSKLMVNLSISEVDVNHIKMGQKVLLSLDAIPAEVYIAQINKIPSVGTRFLGTTVFRITAEILNPDERIKSGMTASAQIIIGEIYDVISVPGKAIQGVDDQLVVYKLVEIGKYPLPSFRRGEDTDSENKASFEIRNTIRFDVQPVTITLGTTSGNYSEILAGDLQPGDEIILNPPE